jgi:hypothetical protein
MALSKELIAPVAGVGSRDDANGLPPGLSSFAPGGRAHRSAINEDCAAQHDEQSLFGVGSGRACPICIHEVCVSHDRRYDLSSRLPNGVWRRTRPFSRSRVAELPSANLSRIRGRLREGPRRGLRGGRGRFGNGLGAAGADVATAGGEGVKVRTVLHCRT